MVCNRLSLQNGKDVVPDKVQLTLQVLYVRGDCDDSILLRHDDDVLATGTVSTEAAWTASPHLVAVALHPVAGLLGHAALSSLFDTRTGVDALYLLLRHLGHPLGGNQLLAVPLAFLKQ